MIYTITLTPAIEKRIHVNTYDELRFEPKTFSYHAGGVGIKTSLYLKKMNIDSIPAYVCGRKEVSLLKETLASKKVEGIAVETNIKTPYHHYFIDEQEEVTLQKEASQSINDAQLALFSIVLCEKMQDKSTVVLEYNDTTVSAKAMQDFYANISSKSEFMICDMHPKYYEVLTHRKADILCISNSNLCTYLNTSILTLEKSIEVIKADLVPLSQIVIYMHTPTDFVVFYKDKIYRVLSMLKVTNENIYTEAILASLVQCLEEDCEFTLLCKECLIASIASNIGDGMYTATALSKEKIMKTIHIYTM